MDEPPDSVVTAVPSRGDFDHRCLVGAFKPVVGDAFRRRTHHGLVIAATSWWGALRSSGGTTYVAQRAVGWDWAQPLVLYVDGTDSCVESWSGSGLDDRVVDRRRAHELRGPSGGDASFRCRMGAGGTFAWQELGALDLEGRRVGPGIQWYDPSAPGAAYASTWQRVSGTVLGDPVEGFVVFEQRCLPSGYLWSDTPYPGDDGLLVAWVTFANEWDDGTVEVGHLCAGERSWGFGLVADADGPIVVTDRVEVDHDTFRAGSETWRWEAEGQLVRRADHHRRPCVWSARLERRGSPGSNPR